MDKDKKRIGSNYHVFIWEGSSLAHMHQGWFPIFMEDHRPCKLNQPAVKIPCDCHYIKGGLKIHSPTPQAFEEFMRWEWNGDVIFLEEIQTFPDRDPEGYCTEHTGDRVDLVFGIHKDDLAKFLCASIKYETLTERRIVWGIRSINDVLDGDERFRYPARFQSYCGIAWSREPANLPKF